MKRSGKRIRKSIYSSLLLFLFVFIAQASAYASTVRGMLFRRDGYGTAYAAPYVGVSLYNSQQGRSSLAYSGTDGMYYLYNVPPGDYSLQIWLAPNRPVVYTIRVLNVPYVDIAPIQIP
jgi:hypothetical protein